MKNTIRRLATLFLVFVLGAAMCLTAGAADKVTRIEDLLQDCTWYVTGGDDGTVTLDKGSATELHMTSKVAGGTMAVYYDDVQMGDGSIRFNLKIKRNPLWTAIMFRVSGGETPNAAIPFYDDTRDKYALFFDGNGVMFISSWKAGTGKQLNLQDAVPGLFDDGEAHQVEIITKNLSKTQVEIKVAVDGVIVTEVIDDGDVEKYGGPAITSAGRVAVHAYQATPSPFGPDITFSAAGKGVAIKTTTTTKATTTTTQAATTTTEAVTTTTLDTATTTLNGVTTTTAADGPVDTDPAETNNGWILWLVIGLVVVAGGAVAVVLVLKKKKA